MKWDIYESKKGHGLINHNITRAYNKFVKIALRDFGKTRGAAIFVQKEMFKVLEKYAEWGACDTEPHCILADRLEKSFGLDRHSLSQYGD